MSSSEGRQSPDPSTQTGKQLHETPGSAGVKESENNPEKRKEELEQQRDNLESNPKGVLDDAVTEKFSKSTKTD